MFEQIPTQAVGESSKETEDIFAAVESPKVVPLSSPPPPSEEKPKITPPLISNHKLIVTVGIVAGILALMGGSFALVRFLRKPAPPTLSPPIISAPLPEVQPLAPLQAQSPPPGPAQENLTKQDSDGDGLTDEEEAKIGTLPNNVDTDGDGLTDFDETRIYKSDPKNSDTDGDSYLDGHEVKNGYNPTGPGKLFGVSG